MSTHREVEVTYGPPEHAGVPDLTGLGGVSAVRHEDPVDLSAVYFDTPDLVLTRSGVSLRRRSGGADEGWHVKLPVEGARDEVQRPLGRSVTVPPKPLRDLVVGWTRRAPLSPVATVDTHRSPILLLGPQGEVLAEFADDRVAATRSDGAQVVWREWELELVDATPELLGDADRFLAAAGVRRARVSRKIERALGEWVPAAPVRRRPRPGKPVSRLVESRLAELVDVLSRRDVDARGGDDEGIHKMRVATRRLRALLATTRPLLDRARTDPVRDELTWLAGVLGASRDAAVVHERLRALLDDEPRELVHGPVRRRLGASLGGVGKADLRGALESDRYFTLRDRLDELLAVPPWTALAEEPARDVAPELLLRELERLRCRAREAAADRDSMVALHEVRKSVKRLCYAAETVAPVGGRAVRRLARAAGEVAEHLGNLQDTTVSSAELLCVADQAFVAGEPTFTYGRLHAREESRARRLAASYWDQDLSASLERCTEDAMAALHGTRADP